MTSTTPTSPPPSRRQRSTSRTRPPHHPTTPLRPPSRGSLHHSTNAAATATTTNTANADPSPLDSLVPQFAELTDSLADLEANMMHIQLLHESVSRFDENFAAFLYGMSMSAFCVDFPEAPAREAWARVAGARERGGAGGGAGGTGSEVDRLGKGSTATMTTGKKGGDLDATFLTTDTSFVNDPPASVARDRFGGGSGGSSAPPGAPGRSGVGQGTRVARGRGGMLSRGGPGGSRGGAPARGSGIGRGKGRGVR